MIMKLDFLLCLGLLLKETCLETANAVLCKEGGRIPSLRVIFLGGISICLKYCRTPDKEGYRDT